MSDHTRYYCIPAGTFSPAGMARLLSACPALGTVEAILAAARGEDAGWCAVRWRPDGGAAMLSVWPGEYPADVEAAVAPYEITYAAALALVATPEWTPTEGDLQCAAP